MMNETTIPEARGLERDGHPAKPVSMKIYFCDLCNESIPLKDINSNRITIEEGKIICQQCAPKRARAMERPPLLVTLGFAVVMLAVLGLIAALIGLQSDLEAQASANAEAHAAMDRRMAEKVALSNLSEARSADLARTNESLAKLGASIERVQRSQSELEGRMAAMLLQIERTLETRASGLDERLRAREKAASEPTAADLGLRDLNAQVLRLEERLGTLLEMMAEGEIRRATAATEEPSRPAESKGGESGASGLSAMPPEEMDRAIDQLLRRMNHPDPSQRYPAVIGLGKLKAPRAIEALQRALQDRESYIRVAAIQKLRGLEARQAVPALIETLRDADYFVRVTANNALTALTGTTVAFDAEGPARDRDRAISAWKGFWEKEGPRLLAE